MKFRRRVSSFFSKRRLLLKNIRGNNVRAEDDFAELYVLLCLVNAASVSYPDRLKAGAKKRTFVVATSPSSQWASASHFVVETASDPKVSYGIRSGFQVQCHDTGTVELDLVIVPISSIIGDVVNGADIASAFEVKVHKRVLVSSLADQVLGKAVRVFDARKVPCYLPSKISRYCLVSARPISDNARRCLTGAGIEWCLFGPELERWIQRTITVLGLA